MDRCFSNGIFIYNALNREKSNYYVISFVTRVNKKIDEEKVEKIIEEVATEYSEVFKGLAKYDKREK